MQLYKLKKEINDEFDRLRDEMENTEEPILDLSWLDELKCAFSDKIDACLAVIKEYKGFIKTIKETKQDLNTKQKILENKVQGLTDYVLQEIEALDDHKFKSALHSAIVVKSPPSVEIIDIDAIPDEYKYQEIIEKIDKNEIIIIHKQNGKKIDGVEIKIGNHLRVK